MSAIENGYVPAFFFIPFHLFEFSMVPLIFHDLPWRIHVYTQGAKWQLSPLGEKFNYLLVIFYFSFIVAIKILLLISIHITSWLKFSDSIHFLHYNNNAIKVLLRLMARWFASQRSFLNFFFIWHRRFHYIHIKMGEVVVQTLKIFPPFLVAAENVNLLGKSCGKIMLIRSGIFPTIPLTWLLKKNNLGTIRVFGRDCASCCVWCEDISEAEDHLFTKCVWYEVLMWFVVKLCWREIYQLCSKLLVLLLGGEKD